MKEDERIAVVLCYSCGMSHSEAAEATGMPLGTVKSHVNRGRAKLQAFFADAEVMVS
ncbi:MAG: RNA polymerase sigma-70 factor (ECF subfamily) [Maricaulis maris]